MHKYLKHAVYLRSISGLADLIREESERQLTDEIAFLVFNWSTSSTFPPGVVRHHLSLFLGIILLPLFFLSSFALLSFFDLDTGEGRVFQQLMHFFAHWEQLSPP